jgi:tRNA(Arg) A34 adenosine deaminase TadA
MCFAACHWARVSKVIHGTFIRDAHEAGFNELAISNSAMKRQGKSQVKIKGGFMRKENQALFRRWSQSKLKRAY